MQFKSVCSGKININFNEKQIRTASSAGTKGLLICNTQGKSKGRNHSRAAADENLNCECQIPGCNNFICKNGHANGNRNLRKGYEQVDGLAEKYATDEQTLEIKF